MMLGLDIDFSILPPFLLDVMRAGTEIQLEWLAAVVTRTKRFQRQLPRPRRPKTITKKTRR